MENTIIINGGRKVSGAIDVPGDKISSVHLLLASLLSNEETIINNINYCQDVIKIIEWIESNDLAELNCYPNYLIVKPKNGILSLSGISDCRASICLLSALAFKYGHTSIRKNIGGCNFSVRPIDRHLELLSELGLRLEKSEGEIIVRKIRQHSGVNFNCSTKFGPSVGVTIHAVLVALVCFV
jgi:UDP-N-acetylglucosamine 1-carboxyvinyltransferase